MHLKYIDVVALLISHDRLIICPFPCTINNESELQASHRVVTQQSNSMCFLCVAWFVHCQAAPESSYVMNSAASLIKSGMIQRMHKPWLQDISTAGTCRQRAWLGT